MNDPANGKEIYSGNETSDAGLYKRDFWSKENLRYVQPHHRLEKSARIINKLAQGEERTLLDVGCGPATLMRLLPPNIKYYGIDMAIYDPAPNLIEADVLEAPIRFGDKRFDIILAQGFFEYAGGFQNQKFAEIAQLLNANGTFVVSYVNFGHRSRVIYWPYSNVQSFDDFYMSLKRYFQVQRFFPTSHNWRHDEPKRRLTKAVNMSNINIPFVSRMLAVEYFFICTSRDSKIQEDPKTDSG